MTLGGGRALHNIHRDAPTGRPFPSARRVKCVTTQGGIDKDENESESESKPRHEDPEESPALNVKGGDEEDFKNSMYTGGAASHESDEWCC